MPINSLNKGLEKCISFVKLKKGTFNYFMNKIIIILVLLLITLVTNAQKNTIKYYYSDSLFLNKILPIFKKNSYTDSLSLIKYLEKSKEIALSKGFIDISIDSISYLNSSVNVFIYLGRLIKNYDIRYDNNYEGILRTVNSVYLEKGVLDINTIEFENQKIIKYLENNGYPKASVKLDSIEIKEDRLSAFLNINRGEQQLYGSVTISGDFDVSNSFLYGYTSIKPGAAYKSEDVKRLRVRINELDFANQNKEVQIKADNNKLDIIIPANKQSNNRFDGILGILPNSETTGKLVLTGELNVFIQNILHSAEQINFQWQKLESTSQKLKIDFNIPYIFNTKLGVLAGIDILKQDSTFLNSELKAGVKFYFQGQNNIGLVYKNKSSNILTQDILLKTLYKGYNINSYGLLIYYRKLDYNFNPHKGVDLFMELNIGNKASKDEQEIEHNQIQYDASYNAKYYLKISKNHTLLLANKAAILFSEQLYNNELYMIGGLKTLRGFMESSIYASSYSIATIEYRFIFERNSAMFLFFDGAWYEKKMDSYYKDYPFGFGLGLFFKTKAGIFTISYAMGQQKNEDLNISNAKIHFGFINKF